MNLKSPALIAAAKGALTARLDEDNEGMNAPWICN